MGKYDQIIMSIEVNGKFVGNIIRKRTARQAWEDRISFAALRKQWHNTIEDGKAFRTPIIKRKTKES